MLFVFNFLGKFGDLVGRALLFGSCLVIQYVTCRYLSQQANGGQEWLWCESWCSESSKKNAKTIDMCCLAAPQQFSHVQPDFRQRLAPKVFHVEVERWRNIHDIDMITDMCINMVWYSHTHNHSYIYLMHTFVPPALGWALFHQITAGLMASMTVPDCIRLPKSLWLCVPIQDKRVRSLPCDQSPPEYGFGSTIFTHIFQKFDASDLTCTIK